MQQENSGEALVTVALCNEKCELLYSRMPMQYVRKMDSFSYFVKDHTAYLDTVDELLSLFCRLRQENGTDRSRVLFFLVTDGLDNSSIRVERSEFEKGWNLFMLRVGKYSLGERILIQNSERHPICF